MKSEQKPPQTALQKMQEIAERLTSNTPELMKCTAVLKADLDNDSILRQKKEPASAISKQKKGGESSL